MQNVQFREIRPTDIEWIVSQHEELYKVEFGFDESFGTMVREIVNSYLKKHNPQREKSWIATKENKRIGMIFCTDEGDDIIQLRMLLVLPNARGTGLGRKLVEECIEFGRQKNYKLMRLWTFKSLLAAVTLYESVGFRCVKENPLNSFGVALVEQVWEAPLNTE